MATIQFYNHTARLIAEYGLANLDITLQLLNASASFTASHTTKAAVDNAGAYECSGNGWTVGGVALANEDFVITETKNAKLIADAIDIVGVGGPIPSTPAPKAQLYANALAGDPPLAFVVFDAALQAGEGTNLRISIPSTGLIKITAP
jgi:hypothetical protein